MQKRNKRFNRKKRHQIQSFFDFIKSFEYNNKNLLFIVIVMSERNTLDNKSDQAPKNTEARYQARIDAIAKEIEAAFDRYTDLMKGDDVIIDRLEKHRGRLRLHKLDQISEWQTLSIELKRESKNDQISEWKENTWEKENIWSLVSPKQLPIFKWRVLRKSNAQLQPGTIATYLVIEKQKRDPRFYKNQDYAISLEQVEIPTKANIFKTWKIFHKKLKGDEAKAVLNNIELSA